MFQTVKDKSVQHVSMSLFHVIKYSAMIAIAVFSFESSESFRLAHPNSISLIHLSFQPILTLSL